MPNWCTNDLYIRGDDDKIAEFIQRVTLSEEQAEKRKQKYDILHNLYPTPEELRNTTSGFFNDPKAQEEHKAKEDANLQKYGFKDWYDWNNANWGTKWGDCDTYISEQDSGRVTFRFDSAWLPPIDGIAHIASLFPELIFVLSYIEEGMDYYGATCFSSTGAFNDDCRQVSDIKGVVGIDWDADDYTEQLENNEDKILEAREELLQEMGVIR